jgi:uncharacterized protein YjbJ (UPF0337 family)
MDPDRVRGAAHEVALKSAGDTKAEAEGKVERAVGKVKTPCAA